MTFIILILGTVILSPFTVGKTPLDLARFLVRKMNEGREKSKELKRRRDEYFDKKEAEQIDIEQAEEEERLALEKEQRRKKELDINIEGPGEPAPDIDDDDEDYDEDGDTIIGPVDPTPIEQPLPTLKSIFAKKEDPEAAEKFKGDGDELEEMEADTDLNGSDGIDAEVSEIPIGEEEDEEYVPEYVFPPVHLLKKAPAITSEMNSEYEQTAKKLVDTLSSFGVKTKVLNIAKGPTVTRYELQPEVGVRVRAIRNLSDDIALSLAAKGVRIEAPIPGKEAVGIEVPNRNTAVVSIRSLIEAPAFESAKSKLTTCLGVDVAGNPVYCDIAKMPHMMIAGTTGSGKSVCINSILMSILYKARPDEVKLILIDPKKIELGVYNGISHLLVPVVSDPKNAAGALAWSVNEMERRFALIEETGVRDIKAYNEVALREGNREVLPHIVIIIDELADLMMMARDTVESSIARIAQKARAAGMHLIIGTQRPSVDVITGLIKANVPSRIAFTVASQVDSRTIIDTVGAEKLVGKGDMLYSPVGAMNPLRVQGSFVSDSEIESVISFLKGNSGASYDEEIMDSIEKEAAKCEKSKSKVSDSEDDFASDDDNSLNSDPMLRPAIEIAIDSGTISTSMLQRRLKLGYARAARLIDKMETLGIVSEFAGSKPRTVLISHEKYMEMVANSEN
ncbi:MAG: DNA translocase FtsK [Clostridia bacterium]|nr:DNA translocase FtsK [Clostridia bacterium]